jgi:hypothetical protein
MKRLLTVYAAVAMMVFINSVARATTSYVFEPFDYPDSLRTGAFDIDGDNIVGFYTDTSGVDHGFLYDGTDWTSIDAPGASATYVLGIDGGVIVGVAADEYGMPCGFLFDGSTWTQIVYPGLDFVAPFGIDEGGIVGACIVSGDDNPHGFFIDISVPIPVPVPVDYPNASQTGALGIDNGRVVGAYMDANTDGHGFIYDVNSELWTSLEHPFGGTSGTWALGIDGNDIVGGYHGDHGFLFDGTDWTSLDYPGALGTWAFGIDDGTIVGWYTDQPGELPWDDFSNVCHGFIATPEPATVALLGIGSLVLLRGKRKWK